MANADENLTSLAEAITSLVMRHRLNFRAKIAKRPNYKNVHYSVFQRTVTFVFMRYLGFCAPIFACSPLQFLETSSALHTHLSNRLNSHFICVAKLQRY